MTSKTFCILPWIHFYANPDGSVLPCCIGDHRLPLGNIQQQSVAEVWNSDRYKQMRLKMLSGEQCSECKSCYQTENAGVNSFRQSVNRDYSEFINLANETNIDGSLDDIKLKYLDIRWSNICNFKCRSCSSTYSSSWATEDNKHGHDKKVFIFAGGKNNDDLYSQLMPYISQVKEIYFAGGEPLLMDKHYEILEHLINLGNTDIKIKYNSNISSLQYKGKSVLDLWKNFSNINLNISLDSWDMRAEYIREGTDWKILEKNIKLVKEICPHVHIGISSVISVFNVYTLPEFIGYLENKNIINNTTPISFYCLINPTYYGFNILDLEIKALIIEKLLSRQYTKNISREIESIIKQLSSSIFDANLQKQFKSHTDYYDTIRDKQFIQTFPELKKFYENIL
jgi:radical SAM protein with 4Fe4S-binding SPASM domain